ncbi:hypothetical protein HID58_074277, partial [Brassica napus]
MLSLRREKLLINVHICLLYGRHVFTDHESSLTPIDVSKHSLWSLARRTMYVGTFIPRIFK